MGHLGERDRVLVCVAVAELLEEISPRLKTRTGRHYVLIVRAHYQVRFELHEL